MEPRSAPSGKALRRFNFGGWSSNEKVWLRWSSTLVTATMNNHPQVGNFQAQSAKSTNLHGTSVSVDWATTRALRCGIDSDRPQFTSSCKHHVSMNRRYRTTYGKLYVCLKSRIKKGDEIPSEICGTRQHLTTHVTEPFTISLTP